MTWGEKDRLEGLGPVRGKYWYLGVESEGGSLGLNPGSQRQGRIHYPQGHCCDGYEHWCDRLNQKQKEGAMNQLAAQGRVLIDFEIGNKTIGWETDGLMSSLLQPRLAQRINKVLFISLILKWEYLCIVV